MTELFDLARHVGRDAAGLASAVEILLRVTAVLAAAMLLGGRPAAIVRGRASPGLDALACRRARGSDRLLGVSRLASGDSAAAGAVARGGRGGSRAARAAGCRRDCLPTRCRTEMPEPFDPATMPDAMPPDTRAGRRAGASRADARRGDPNRPHAAPAWSWSAVLGVVWATGTCSGVGVVGGRHRRGVARRAACLPAADEPWRRLLRAARRRVRPSPSGRGARIAAGVGADDLGAASAGDSRARRQCRVVRGSPAERALARAGPHPPRRLPDAPVGPAGVRRVLVPSAGVAGGPAVAQDGRAGGRRRGSLVEHRPAGLRRSIWWPSPARSAAWPCSATSPCRWRRLRTSKAACWRSSIRSETTAACGARPATPWCCWPRRC